MIVNNEFFFLLNLKFSIFNFLFIDSKFSIIYPFVREINSKMEEKESFVLFLIKFLGMILKENSIYKQEKNIILLMLQ